MPTAPKSLTCSLDWRDVLTAIGLDCLPLAVLPQSAECPLCGYGIITAMEDPVLDSVWFHCPECRFAGDIMQLAGAHLDCSEREAIVSLSALRVMPEELSDKDVEDYLTFHLQPRRRINDFWEAARLRPMMPTQPQQLPSRARSCAAASAQLLPSPPPPSSPGSSVRFL